MASPNGALVVLLAGGLAGVHVVAGRLRFLRVVPRSRYLSVAGSVSVAYVFVHLLPEITERQATFEAEREAANPLVVLAGEQALFLVALAGFAAFYGLEQYAVRSRRQTGTQTVAGGATTRTAASTFWLHLGSFAVYNGLVGYFLLHREETGTADLLLYAVAMALHFVVNDYGLREHHEDAYSRVGRWLLVGGVLAGVGVGFLVPVAESVLSLLLAFLAGGVILNVIKEELPEERESSFPAFGLGLAGYTLVLLVI